MAVRGQELLRYITADWYRQQTLYNKPELGAPVSDQGEQNQYVNVVNHSTTAFNKWEPVSLGSSVYDYTEALTNSDHDILTFNTKDLSGDDPHNIAILQEPLEGRSGATALALIHGSSWLITPQAFTYNTVLKISGNMLADAEGPGRVEVIQGYAVATAAPPVPPVVPFAPFGPTALSLHGVFIAPHTLSTTSSICLVRIGKMSGTGIIDIRVNGFDLQYTFNGTDWITWHTGVQCSS